MLYSLESLCHFKFRLTQSYASWFIKQLEFRHRLLHFLSIWIDELCIDTESSISYVRAIRKVEIYVKAIVYRCLIIRSLWHIPFHYVYLKQYISSGFVEIAVSLKKIIFGLKSHKRQLFFSRFLFQSKICHFCFHYAL